MQGTRLHKIEGEQDFVYRMWKVPGAYGTPDSGKSWFCTTPNGMLGNISGHQVTEHADGTITVSPSILTQSQHKGKTWHGYLEKGIWREC